MTQVTDNHHHRLRKMSYSPYDKCFANLFYEVSKNWLGSYALELRRKFGHRRELYNGADTCSYHVEMSSEESCCPPPPARCRWALDSPTSAPTPSPQKNNFIQPTEKQGCGSGSRITLLLLMQIRIRIQSDFSLKCGSGSCSYTKWCESANTGLTTLQDSILSLHDSILSLWSSWILTSMRIRIQLLFLMRIQFPQKMRIWSATLQRSTKYYRKGKQKTTEMQCCKSGINLWNYR